MKSDAKVFYSLSLLSMNNTTQFITVIQATTSKIRKKKYARNIYFITFVPLLSKIAVLDCNGNKK